MNEEFSGRRPGTRARENRGNRGVGALGEERTGDGKRE